MNSRGAITLSQIILLVAMLAIFEAGFSSLMSAQSSVQAESTLKASAMAIRQNVLAMVNHPVAWKITHARNPGINCTSPDMYACNPAAPGNSVAIKLYDNSKNLILDTTENAGFTIYGEPCQKFDARNGNDFCPLKVTLKWRAGCDAKTCTPAIAASFVSQAPEHITMTFTYLPRSKGAHPPFNPSAFNLAEQPRLNLQSKKSPALVCAKTGTIFIGIGKKYNGQTADTNGCVTPGAFRGPVGNMGPKGPDGPAGDMGPPGPTEPCPPGLTPAS